MRQRRRNVAQQYWANALAVVHKRGGDKCIAERRLDTLHAHAGANCGLAAVRTGVLRGFRSRISRGCGADVGHANGLVAGFLNSSSLGGRSTADRHSMGHLHACRSKGTRGAIQHQSYAKKHSQEN